MECAQGAPFVSDESKTETDGEIVDLGSRKTRPPYLLEIIGKAAVDYYNDKHIKKDEDRMEYEKTKEGIFNLVPEIFLITFEAKFLSKDGSETKRTECRAVVFREYLVGTLDVYSVKLGTLDEKDFKEWKKRLNFSVLFSESQELEPKEPEFKEVIRENQLPMEGAQKISSESNKRKREGTVSPTTRSDDNDDTLEVKHGRKKSSLSSEDLKPVYIDTGDVSSEHGKPVCTDTGDESSEDDKPVCIDTGDVSSEDDTQVYIDTVDISSEDVAPEYEEWEEGLTLLQFAMGLKNLLISQWLITITSQKTRTLSSSQRLRRPFSNLRFTCAII